MAPCSDRVPDRRHAATAAALPRLAFVLLLAVPVPAAAGCPGAGIPCDPPGGLDRQDRLEQDLRLRRLEQRQRRDLIDQRMERRRIDMRYRRPVERPPLGSP